MSYNPPTSRSTGDLITASIWNADIVANIVAMFAGAMGLGGQAANDLIYAASSSQLARLAMGASTGMPLASVAAGAPVWGGDLDWLGSLLKNAQMQGYSATLPTPAIAANVLTVDYKAGNVQSVAFNANISTFTINNVPASGKYAGFTLVLTADGTPRTCTFLTSTVKWGNSGAPAFTSANGKIDKFFLWTKDGGITWCGHTIGQNL